ncbi:hypothetical protein llap_9222 [Limosa lapponica baueri]|uniref:Uncharacterized protein n=1 Tax=Limosa lapponica baueri TaxID=1758121 RepID=A0A2I0U314_LIMLA|nr:hypothetical protein llap_9222 [Limosa lapponica baueri]
MRNKADQQLVEIDKKYAGFIHSMVKDKKKERKPSSDEETESDSNSGSESESEEEASKPRRLRKRVDSDSDSDEENDINAVMKCLPENSAPLIEFANVSQGILLLLMLKQHLKNLCGFSDRDYLNKLVLTSEELSPIAALSAAVLKAHLAVLETSILLPKIQDGDLADFHPPGD